MVEEEIEFGDSDLLKSQNHRYTLCDGCDVELTASDDIFEKNCKYQHIICSDCYNLWMDGFEKLNFIITQDWRKQIQHCLCPICDDVIGEDGKLNLNKISQQIDNITNNIHASAYSAKYKISTNHTTSNESVELSSSSAPTINILNGHSPTTTLTDDTSHSNFEIISTAGILN